MAGQGRCLSSFSSSADTVSKLWTVTKFPERKKKWCGAARGQQNSKRLSLNLINHLIYPSCCCHVNTPEHIRDEKLNAELEEKTALQKTSLPIRVQKTQNTSKKRRKFTGNQALPDLNIVDGIPASCYSPLTGHAYHSLTSAGNCMCMCMCMFMDCGKAEIWKEHANSR